jgi:glycerophosphoryl diester phosphodiesterase
MWSYPRIFAHRGGGTLAPENTLAALRHAAALGFWAVEFDVMALRDDGLVLMHDETRGRTVAGSGSLGSLDSASVCAMDAGQWFSAEFSGETVPSFAAAAELCLRSGLFMNVEIKPLAGEQARTGRLVAQACGALPEGSVLLSSFSVEALEAARRAAPARPRALLVGAVPLNWRETMAALAAVALHAKASLLTAEQAKAVKAAGYGLFGYTVNDPAQARALFAMGVDAICTDRLDLIGPDFFKAQDSV